MTTFKLHKNADIWKVAEWMNSMFGYHNEGVTWFWHTYVEEHPLKISGLETAHEGVAIWGGTPSQHTFAKMKWA